MTATARPRAITSALDSYAIEAYNMRKTYRSRKGRQVALAGLDLKVPAGGVHGFLGPNGAGKTTTLRMLLGLIRADSGYMRVFDQEVPRGLPQVVDRIGAIIEQPRFFPTFSGRKNLRLLARAMGVPFGRVGQVLAEVGLADRANSRFGTYSLGMKQRLAIAATLLKDPDLLIFDEPTNGLDPAGIHEIRSTMRRLAESGKTVLVSSHILSEVQQVADTVTIIGRGRLLAEGRVEDILAVGGQSVRVGVDDTPLAAQLLADAGLVVTPAPGRLLSVTSPDHRNRLDPATITRLLAQRGLYVYELTTVRADLESVFLELTADEQLGAREQPAVARRSIGPASPPGGRAIASRR
jgi:ABC-type multidrug transport system ATPase subunit